MREGDVVHVSHLEFAEEANERGEVVAPGVQRARGVAVGREPVQVILHGTFKCDGQLRSAISVYGPIFGYVFGLFVVPDVQRREPDEPRELARYS